MRYLIFSLLLWCTQATAFTSDEEFDMLEQAVNEAVSAGDNRRAYFNGNSTVCPRSCTYCAVECVV